MSYTPTLWKAGDTVTSAKLNKIENGIADTVQVIDITSDNEEHPHLGNDDITYQSLANALQAGKIIIFRIIQNNFMTYGMGMMLNIEAEKYYCYINNIEFEAESATEPLMVSLSSDPSLK